MTAFRGFLGCTPSERCWGLVFKSRVRPSLIVVQAPSLDDGLDFRQRSDPMDVEALVPQRSVECFDETVVSWFAWSAEIDLRVLVVGPEIEYLPVEFTTVVDKQAFRCGSLRQNSVKRGDHMFATRPLAGDDGQGFTVWSRFCQSCG